MTGFMFDNRLKNFKIIGCLPPYINRFFAMYFKCTGRCNIIYQIDRVSCRILRKFFSFFI